MALALEGVAGALHAGLHIDEAELEAAAKAAQQVWEAGPKPEPGRHHEFEAARDRLREAAPGCAKGQAREAGLVERSAITMALQLRWMAQDLAAQPARKEPPKEAGQAIAALSAKYRRHGRRAAAA